MVLVLSMLPRPQDDDFFSAQELQRHAVHAVAQAGGLGPVVEHVAEMAAAATAMHLGAQHEQAAVAGGADGVVERRVEAGPAGAAVELGGGGEQRQVAAGAVVGAGAVLLVERAGAGALGAVLAQHVELLRREQLLPFLVGLGDLEGLGVLASRLSRQWRGAPRRRARRPKCPRAQRLRRLNIWRLLPWLPARRGLADSAIACLSI